MNPKLKQLLRDESGITALETAIILIAFVVVAAVFAFTILSAGTFTTEQSREAIYSGLEEVQGSVERRGEVVAECDSGKTKIMTVTFSIANTAGGEAVDVTEPGATEANKMLIQYRDPENDAQVANWTTDWLIGGTKTGGDGDQLLEEGELVDLIVPIPVDLEVNTKFVIEIKPPRGATLLIERTTPAYFDLVMDLR